MTEDINRGIKVDYLKELNLPKTISFENGYIENRYFYDGTKYRKQEFDPGGNLLNDEKYFGNLVLRNGRPNWLKSSSPACASARLGQG